VAARTPDDFLRAHFCLSRDARRKFVLSKFGFVFFLVWCLRGVVTAQDFSGSCQAFVQYRKNRAEPHAGDAMAYLALS
jgi:hypothetical protein